MFHCFIYHAIVHPGSFLAISGNAIAAKEPLNGNPLALVIDAQELSQQTMQCIAREFNQSETAFPLSPTKPQADWRLHCFTPAGVEVSGVGHHALRVWWWLAEAGRL